MSKSVESEIESAILDLFNILYDENLTSNDIELYELKRETDEGEIYLPHIGINYELWQEWSNEKRIEVLIHEFAHDEKYSDDHQPSFWNRVVRLTQKTVQHRHETEDKIGEFNPEKLKQTVVESVHRGVIETDTDTVEKRRKKVREKLKHRNTPTEEHSTPEIGE